MPNKVIARNKKMGTLLGLFIIFLNFVRKSPPNKNRMIMSRVEALINVVGKFTLKQARIIELVKRN